MIGELFAIMYGGRGVSRVSLVSGMFILMVVSMREGREIV